MLYAFQSEQAALDRFINILQDEQSALVNADIERLVSISQDKSGQAEQLNHLARERLAALAKRGVSGDRASVEAWLTTQPTDVRDAWLALIDRARTAQELNQINGKLIETQLQNTQQALNALSNAANQSTVYGADGQTRGIQPSAQRILGKG